MTRQKNIFRLFLILALLPFLPQVIKGAGGDLDTTFSAGAAQFGTTADAVAVQTDGRILIGGNFRTVNGRFSPGVARLNADGTFDQSFNVGTGTDNGFSAANVYTIAVQTDGRILIGGFFTQFNGTSVNYLARLNADGSLDTTFNMGGAGISGSSVEAITIEPDGQILVGGFFSQYNGTTVGFFLRLNSNGSLDTTFNTNIGTGFNFTTRSIALEPDGQIVVGGQFTSLNGTSANYIARLNANGTPDAAFITNNGTGFNTQVATVALQADGRIVCGGNFSNFNGTSQFYLARLNANGTLDTGFASASQNAAIEDIQIQADGQILAAGAGFFGAMSERQNLVRINQTDGTLDLSFDAGTGPNTTFISSLAIQTDGSVLAVGNFTGFNGVTRSAIAKVSSSGSLNTTFTTVIGSPASVNEILVLPDNKMFIGGDFRGVNESFRDALARINADGTTDTTFNPTGLDTGGFGVVNAIAVQTDGKVIVGGNFSNAAQGFNFGIVRLNADGSLDNTFNAFTNGAINTVAVQTDGRILIGGNFTFVNGTNIQFLARLNADGTTDTTFNNGGSGFDSSVQDLALLSGGQILVGGDFTAYNGTMGVNRIARLNANGTLDAAFTANTGTGFDSSVNTLAVQTNGRIVAGGNFGLFNGSNRNAIARLNSNGTLDGTFSVGAGFNNSPIDLILQTDGRILAVGFFSAYNGITRFNLARINADGSLDSSFDSGALVNTNLAAIGLQTDGRIIIGGNFSQYDGIARISIARLLAGDTIIWTGAMNTNWNTGANWIGGIVPTSVDNAVIPDNFTVNLSGGSFSVLSLTVGANTTLTITATNSLSIEGGTNNGTISGAGTLNFNGASLGNNGTISVSSVNVNTAGNKALTGNGAFVGNLLTIAPSITLALQSNHQFNEIDVQANAFFDTTSRTVSLRGTNPLQGAGFIGNDFGTIIFDGTAAQSNSHSVNFNNLTINNPAGVTFSNSGSFTVAGTLDLQNGILNISSPNFLFFADNAAAIRTNGYVIGAVRKNYSSAGLPAFTFPIGTANGYSPVTVAITSGTTQVTANVAQTNQPNLNAAISLRRYWSLSGTGTFTASLTFNYLQTDVAGNESLYVITRVTGGVPLQFANNCGMGSPCVNTAVNTAFISGVTAFSDWTTAQLAPLAADVSVGGRVTNSFGNGIGKTSVTLINSNGSTRTILTNAFGFYRFDNLEAGATYTISVRNKRFVFNPDTMLITPSENVENADFIASP